MAPSLTSFSMSVRISALQRDLPDHHLVALYLLIPVYFFRAFVTTLHYMILVLVYLLTVCLPHSGARDFVLLFNGYNTVRADLRSSVNVYYKHAGLAKTLGGRGSF